LGSAVYVRPSVERQNCCLSELGVSVVSEDAALRDHDADLHRVGRPDGDPA
jgi:hypothetical protein